MISWIKWFIKTVKCNHNNVEYLGILDHMEKFYICKDCGRQGGYKSFEQRSDE